MYLNRTLCDVLEEMRKCCITSNYSYLPGLIEEAQSMGNRMEAGLGEKRDLAQWRKEWAEGRNDIKQLREEIRTLEEQKQALADKGPEISTLPHSE